jgi:NADPH-dependent glutamate synthase beta subunit-like oxidoreductase/ferredoxin
MIKLKINNIPVEIPEGTSLIRAAADLGIGIPSLCYRNGNTVHPSCMVCMVKDLRNGKLYPSCAMQAAEGMDIITDSEELNLLRKEALELLLSDHIGDCEAPCRLSCPAFMNIPLMNRLIADGKFDDALQVVREEIALPFILGYICPAPCEKACKRKPIDGAVSICLLKRSTASDYVRLNNRIKPASVKSGKRVAIIGTGPAGLSAAFYLLKAGHECVLFDKQEQAGGALRYSIPDAELPREVLDAEIKTLRLLGASFIMNTNTSVTLLKANGHGVFDAFILATGNQELHPADEALFLEENAPHFIHRETFQTSLPGVFACGSIVKELNMAVRAGAQGKSAALNVHRFLMGESPVGKSSVFNSVAGPLKQEEFAEYLKESKSLNEPVLPKNNFKGGYTEQEAIEEAKRCMHCDCRKPISCKLRISANQYQADRKRFAGSYRKQLVKSIQHELVIYEPEKCIKCGLCIEIASRFSESLGLTFVGRGFDVQVNVPFNKTTKEALTLSANECAEACPTGALAIKLKEETLNFDLGA